MFELQRQIVHLIEILALFRLSLSESSNKETKFKFFEYVFEKKDGLHEVIWILDIFVVPFLCYPLDKNMNENFYFK